MRHPVRDLAGHLMWTTDGSCWAMWQLDALPYGLRPDNEKHLVRSAHQALYRSLSGSPMLLSLVVRQDPVSIVERMIDGVDLEENPGWAAECDATLDSLEPLALGLRTYWLCVPLRNLGIFDKAKDSIHSAQDRLKDNLGLPRARVSPAEIERRHTQAAAIGQIIPRVFNPRPATLAQQVWVHQTNALRGLDEAPTSPSPRPDDDLGLHGGCLIPEPVLDEGGQTELSRTELRNWNPFARRFVKVMTDDTAASMTGSYQSMIALTGLRPGLAFPDGELLGRIDEWLPGADWVQRMTIVPNEATRGKNARALRKLNDQYDQRSAEMATAHNELDAALRDLASLEKIMAEDSNELEIQPTTIFAITGGDSDEVQRRTRDAVDVLRHMDFSVAWPTGYQAAMWWAFTPGASMDTKVAEFKQITTTSQLSALCPITTSELGDRTGLLLGLNISTGLSSAVLLDLEGTTQTRNMSGSFGVVGDLGSGKSTASKTIAYGTHELGGRVIAVDRTPVGEWATFLSSLADSIIIDPVDPTYSLDPLRLFSPQAGGRIAQSFLTPLLNIAATDESGVLLSEILEPDYLTRHGLTGLGDVMDHLAASESKIAQELARRMKVFARKDFGKVIFDYTLEPLPMDSRNLVVRTYQLDLPEQHELESAHLFRNMRLEKIYGRAMYSLITSLAREICFADPTQFCLFFLDEAHHVTRNPEQLAEILIFVRDGRKHGAAIGLGSHDPENDFGDETLRGLLPLRLVMRQTDKALAQRSLRWLGMDPEDKGMLDELMKDTSPQEAGGVAAHRRGEGLYRDANGAVGRIKVLMPARPEVARAASTNPSELKA